MNTRTLVKSGTGSFVVSLPIKWIKKNKLDRGAVLYVDEMPNNSVVISTLKREEKDDAKVITINTEKRDFQDVRTLLVSAYINNHSEIRIVGDNLESMQKEVLDEIYSLIGLNTISITKDKIIAQDILHLGAINIDKTTRNMDIMIRSLIGTIRDCLKGENLYDSLIYSESNISGQKFLIIKVLRSALLDVHIATKLNISPIDSLKLMNLANYLGSIANSVRSISKLLPQIKGTYVEDFKESLNKFEKLYLDAITSWYKNDKELALKVIGSYADLYYKVDASSMKHRSFPLTKLNEELLAMALFSRQIANIVVDKII